MALLLSPYVIDDANTKLYLPCPIPTFTITTPYKSDVKEVPVTDGGVSFGHATGLLQINIEGDAYKTPDGVLEIEVEAFDYLVSIKELCDGITESNKLRLVLYNDDDTVFRWYDNIIAATFTIDLGDAASEEPRRPTYSLSLIGEDPSVHTDTAPDSA